MLFSWSVPLPLSCSPWNIWEEVNGYLCKLVNVTMSRRQRIRVAPSAVSPSVVWSGSRAGADDFSPAQMQMLQNLISSATTETHLGCQTRSISKPPPVPCRLPHQVGTLLFPAIYLSQLRTKSYGKIH